MRSICCTLLCIVALLPRGAFAQSSGRISGSVSDSIKAIPFVTVRLSKTGNLSILQSTASKEDGSFLLHRPDSGSYTLSFTHTGFSEKKISIDVGHETADLHLPTIVLTRVSATLGEVRVQAQRSLIDQSEDKIVFNVDQDPSAASETVIDLLRKTPFVTVDGDDNIKVNGKSNFKVLLNGRETAMFARNVKEALRGFPGTLISKIEVITAPSAKYDGEGIGGLINIITKKKIIGYNGTISTFSRTSDKLNNFSINGNAKMGSVGLSMFFNQGFSDPVSQGNTSITTPTQATAYSKRTLDGDQRNSSGWSFGNAELSWEMDTLNTVSLYTNIDSWNNKTVTRQTITTEFKQAAPTVSNYELFNKVNNPGVNIGSDYIRRFANKKDREFSLRFLGEFGKNEAELNSFQDNPGTDRYLLNESHAINNQFTIQADNGIPLAKTGKLEAGVKAILRRASSNFQSLIKYDANSDFRENIANTDVFKYTQDVYSVYGMYSIKRKKSGFRIGGRMEYTNVNGDFTTSKTNVKNDYATFLPNLQFSNRINDTYNLVFTYTKRLQRPYIWDLNPFVSNNDSLNISYGNPDLGPQTMHILVSQLRYGKGNTFAAINIETSYSNNKILQYASFDPSTGITRTTSLNIGREFQSSLNLNLNMKFNPKWDLFVDGSVRYATVRNNSDPTQRNSGFGCNFFINTGYRFTQRFSASTLLGMWKDPQTIQTTYPFMTWHNISLNYKLFNNKINISMRTVNYYEKFRSYTTVTKDRNFSNSNSVRQIRRGAVLALRWNFGKLSENVSRKKGVTNDDILTKPTAPSGN